MGFRKAVLTGRFIEIQAYLKKQEKHQINDLTLHLRQLEKEEMKNAEVSRRKEIIEIRAEISEKERKETSKISKSKSWFFEKIIKKIRQTISPTHQERKGEESVQQIRSENGKVTTDNTEIQRIIRDYYQQLYD